MTNAQLTGIRQMWVGKPIKVTRCKEWPNKLGFDCTVNGTRFQVTSDRELGRLIALRENDRHEFTHSLRICDRRGAEWAADLRTVAELVYRMWIDARGTWTHHGDDDR